MSISFGQIAVWLIAGVLAGWLVGMIVRQHRDGFGKWQNLLIGVAGAVIGGMLFDLFNVQIGADFNISFNDIVAAVAGSLVIVAALALLQNHNITIRLPFKNPFSKKS